MADILKRLRELYNMKKVRKKVLAEVNDMENEEIVGLLREIGAHVKDGKRQSLIDAVVDSICGGTIEMSDEKYEKPAKKSGATAKKPKREKFLLIEGELGEYNDVKNKKMTPERKNAVNTATEAMERQFENEDLTREDMFSFIEDYFDGCSDGELFEAYKVLALLYIDDGGEKREKEDPYLVNEVSFCCGRPLAKAKNGLLKCNACGNRYEAEDD